MNKKNLIFSLALSMLSLVGNAADDLPALRVSGKKLVDASGNSVVLHGVMDTPNRYFNGWRWQTWKADYSKVDVQPCLDYFEKIFTAITDKEHGAYCDVFRLHLDPCWTNDPNKVSDGKESGEADISRFSESRYKDYLQWLYIPLIKKALAHGLYVVVRPPGVCPQTLHVDDYYSEYLKTVWSIFASDTFVQEHAGQISIELANEPVKILDASEKEVATNMRNFFQPVVDAIRNAGFTGIVWVPGTGWQSNYVNYKSFPIKDATNNFGYAVHCYPGWYGTDSETGLQPKIMAKNFLAKVPVVKNKPVIVTEIDWSPEKPGAGHYNEHGTWVPANYGTWGTATTSGFGNAWKYVHDFFGNISMTLQGTGTYLDIDKYLKDGTVTPAFDGIEEACAAACWKWYKEWSPAGTETSIENVKKQDMDASAVKYTYYYNITGERVVKPQTGVYIIKQVLNDGNVRIRKVCYKK